MRARGGAILLPSSTGKYRKKLITEHFVKLSNPPYYKNYTVWSRSIGFQAYSDKPLYLGPAHSGLPSSEMWYPRITEGAAGSIWSTIPHVCPGTSLPEMSYFTGPHPSDLPSSPALRSTSQSPPPLGHQLLPSPGVSLSRTATSTPKRTLGSEIRL